MRNIEREGEKGIEIWRGGDNGRDRGRDGERMNPSHPIFYVKRPQTQIRIPLWVYLGNSAAGNRDDCLNYAVCLNTSFRQPAIFITASLEVPAQLANDPDVVAQPQYVVC